MAYINIGVVWTRMNGLNDDTVKNKIKDELKFHPLNFWFSPKYQNKIVEEGKTLLFDVKLPNGTIMKAGTTPTETIREWDGYSNLIIDKGYNQIFLTGLLPRVIKILKDNNIEFKINREYNNNFDILDVPLKDIELRDYQKEAVEICKRSKRGIIHAATGAGKTLVMFKLAADIQLKTLIIVNRVTLFRQLLSRLKDNLNLKNDEINQISGDEKFYNPNNRITIATFQSLYVEDKNIETKKKIVLKHEEVMKNAEAIILDECHHTSINVLGQILKHCKNAYFRAGFSATPFREDGYDLLLEAHIGPILHHTGISDLIKRGLLAKPKIYVLKSPYYIAGRLSYAKSYKLLIHNEPKNELIANIAYKFAKLNKPVLISFTRIEHLNLVYKILKNMNVDKFVIKKIIGANTTDEKEEAIEKLNKNKFNIVLSTLFGEGVDVKCMTGDTKIKLLNGTNWDIKHLYKKKIKYFWVYSITPDGEIQPAKASMVILTKKNVNVIKIILDNNQYFKCTPEHQIMMRNGKYKQAKDLKNNDSLMPLHCKHLSESKSKKLKGKITPQLIAMWKGSHKKYGKKLPKILKNNHKIKKIQILRKKENVYDIEMVTPNNNFALTCGVFVHNCLSTLINCRNSKSKVDTIQQTGRVLRISEDKQPIIIDFMDYNSYNGIKKEKMFDGEDDTDLDMGENKDYFKNYAKEKLKFYRSEPEFKVREIDSMDEIEEIKDV